MKILVKYLPGAEELYYKTEGSACADLRYFDADGSKPELAIMPGETVMIHTGVSMWINDPKFTALVFPRSGLGSKGLILANTVGVIDSDYYGNISNDGNLGLRLYNFGDEPYEIKVGDKIGQGIFMKYLTVDEEETIDNERNGGIGSTGK